MGLISLLKGLTSDERIDKALAEHCDYLEKEWTRAWTGISDLGNERQLLHYVPARFSVELTSEEFLRRARQGQVRDPNADRFEPVTGESEEEVLDKLLNLGSALCITEGPGAGKTIFSRRLQAYLASREAWDRYFHGRPPLVVRWEESTETSGKWPADFDAALAHLIEPRLPKECDAMAVVEQLQRENRVVLILDALDQATEQGKAEFTSFLGKLGGSEERGAPLACRLIVTSRPHADALVRGRVDIRFRMARIERWDVRRQYAYLFGPTRSVAPIGGAWLDRQIEIPEESRLIPEATFRANASPDAVEGALRTAIRSLIPAVNDDDPIVSSPQSLYLIRQFFLDRSIEQQGQPVSFKSLGDLYRQVCRRSLECAYQKTVRSEKPVANNILDWLEAMLGAMAMQMLITDPVRFSFGEKPEDDLSSLERNALSRVTLAQPSFPSPLKEMSSPWEMVFAVSQVTNRLTGVFMNSSRLAWPDQRMKEYYAARHLVRNGQSNWVARPSEGPMECGDAAVRQYAAHPQWPHVWRLALDLAATRHRDVETTMASLSVLFLAPQEKFLRPTQPMYRAWELFQRPEFQSEGQKILASFQNQFTKLLTGDDLDKARIAAQLVPEYVLRDLVRVHDRLDKLLPSQEEPAFVLCPPEGWTNPTDPGRDPCIFWMGTHSSQKHDNIYNDERPRHPVRLTPFWMQSTSVTNKQYALFDPAFEKNDEHREYFSNYSNERECPVIMTHWFDATMFALWTGAQLPTEAQREFAARAGRDGVGELFGVPCNGQYDQLTSQVANFEGRYAYPDAEIDSKKIYPKTTLPVRWTDRRRAESTLEEARKPPAFKANAWRLWQMQGNVWEWCSSITDDYRQRAHDLTGLPLDSSIEEFETALSRFDPSRLRELPATHDFSAGARRVLRGGGWLDFGRNCRAAFRFLLHSPDVRINNIGFRLCRCLPSPSRP